MRNNQPARKPRPAQTRPPAKRRNGCLIWGLLGCVGALCLGVALTGGGWYAWDSGMITLDDVLSLAGMGPADIEVDNFRDEAIQINILQLDVAAEATPYQLSLQINSLDIQTSRVPQAGRYQVSFGTTSGGAELGACTLTLKSGDFYQFVPTPQLIVVNNVNDPVSIGSDLVVSTSALCR